MKLAKTMGGILMVAGTAIGAGMLALPVQTASLGFVPSSFALIISAFFMALSALYLLEVNLWLKDKSTLISMANATLGKTGKTLTWLSYLLLLYALLSAYLKGASGWLLTSLSATSIQLSEPCAMLLIALVTGFCIAYGTKAVDYLNRYLSLGLITAYLLLLTLALPKVDIALLKFNDYEKFGQVFPLMLTSFGFSIIVPSLNHYFKGSKLQLLTVILGGTLLTLMVYLFWEAVIFGLIPSDGVNGLNAIATQGDNGTRVVLALQAITQHSFIGHCAGIFAICAITTSFLGVSLSAFHFLEEASHTYIKKPQPLLLLLILFLPPFCWAIFFPQGFEQILSLAGLFVAFLLGILPAWMLYRGRYTLKLSHGFKTPGGRPLIIICLLFFSTVILIDVWQCFVV